MENEKSTGRSGERSGRTYFSRQAEQKVFFYLTLIMLLAGLVCRLV